MLWLISFVLIGVFGLVGANSEYVLDHPPSDTECFSIEFQVNDEAWVLFKFAKDQGPKKEYDEGILELGLGFSGSTTVVGYTNERGLLTAPQELNDLDGNPIGNEIDLKLFEKQRFRVSLRTRKGNFVFNVQQVNSTRIDEGVSFQIPIRDGTIPIHYFYILEERLSSSDPIVSPCERPLTTPIPTSTTERPSLPPSSQDSCCVNETPKNGFKVKIDIDLKTVKENQLDILLSSTHRCSISEEYVPLRIHFDLTKNRISFEQYSRLEHDYKQETTLFVNGNEKLADGKLTIEIKVAQDKYFVEWRLDGKSEANGQFNLPVKVPLSNIEFVKVCSKKETKADIFMSKTVNGVSKMVECDLHNDFHSTTHSTTSIAPSTTRTTPKSMSNQDGCKMTNLTEKGNSLELPVKLCENCVIDVNGILKKGASHLQVLLSLAKGCGEERKDSDDSLDIYHNFIGKKEVIIRQRKDEKFVDPIIKAYQILRPCYRFHIRISVTKDDKYQIVWVDRRDETSYDPIQVPISQVKYINVCGETKDISISLQCS